MRARNFGKIINVSSIGGKCAFPLGGWYHASKFALEGYSDSLRMEVRPFGIDVIVIEPGGTESEWADIAAKESERYSGE
jgi:short-subunit dehydrogenase